MTPRELPKYEVLFFLFDFDLVGRVRAFLAGRAHPIQKSFPKPKPLPVQLLKDREILNEIEFHG